jgi:uncharacterized protein (DUF2384 family)
VDNLSNACFHVFWQIADKWNLTVAEQLILLGGMPRSTFYLNKKKHIKSEPIKLSQDTIDRVTYIYSIFTSLRTLYPFNKEIADTWIKRKNSYLDNETPLNIMLEGHIYNLAQIEKYLLAVLNA